MKHQEQVQDTPHRDIPGLTVRLDERTVARLAGCQVSADKILVPSNGPSRKGPSLTQLHVFHPLCYIISIHLTGIDDGVSLTIFYFNQLYITKHLTLG